MEEREIVEYTGGGLVSIEQSRAVQEVQGQMVIAKKFPREERVSRDRVLKACQSFRLAEVAEYAYPRSSTTITGPSIRLAEVLARCWTNINFGLIEVNQADGSSDVIAFAWDLETNVKVTREFKVGHRMKAHGKIKELTDPRDIYEIVANQGQRRVRACILELIPGNIVDEALEACQQTIKTATGNVPIEERASKMLAKFEALDVTQNMIEKRLGHPIKSIIEQELIALGKIYTAISDGIGKKEEYFNEIIPKTESTGKGLDEPGTKSGGEYKTTEISGEETPKFFQCPECSFKTESERGLKKHITQSHKTKTGESSTSGDGIPAWHNDDFWHRQVSGFIDLLTTDELNEILTKFGATMFQEVPKEKREECWKALSRKEEEKSN